jgi:hypothetical protein
LARGGGGKYFGDPKCFRDGKLATKYVYRKPVTD